jgi:hypothetical protein
VRVVLAHLLLATHTYRFVLLYAICPGVPLDVLLVGTELDINLAGIELAKFPAVIVLTLALPDGFTKTTTLSVEDRVLATGSADIFTSDML